MHALLPKGLGDQTPKPNKLYANILIIYKLQFISLRWQPIWWHQFKLKYEPAPDVVWLTMRAPETEEVNTHDNPKQEA